jgi:hypothetical protein
MQQARTISMPLMMASLPCIAHKLVSLMTSIMKYSTASWRARTACALYLQVSLSNFLCKLAYKTLEGGFPDEEICCFCESYGSPLESQFLDKSSKAFSRLSSGAWTVVQPVWLNKGCCAHGNNLYEYGGYLKITKVHIFKSI